MILIIDFKITNSGDLILTNHKNEEPFRIDFFIDSFPIFNINFLQGEENTSKNVIPNNCFNLKFKVKNELVGYEKAKKAKIVRNLEEIKQRILIKLRTEYGDLSYNKTFGTTLWQIKHLDIRNKDTISKLQKIVEDAIFPILSEPKVVLKKSKYDGVFFCQNINIYIYNYDELVYNFSLQESQ